MPTLLERKEEYQPLPEKALARLWQKRAARQREFRTSAGRRVRVLYPGRPGTAAGPDFRDALLEVEGLGLVQGDVELHLRQQDWYAHGHADDPNYNGVVLHAALETVPQVTNLQNGHRAPVISLASLLEEEEPAAETDSAAGPGTAASAGLWPLLERKGWGRPEDAQGMGVLLDAAGDARFRAKAAIFAALMREQSPAQTLYEALMEALGYRANRQPFLKLAQRAPWQSLAAEALALPPEERASAIEERLLEVSGLAPAEERRRRRPPGYGPALNADEWHTFRVRPANHPRHRIGGASRLLARCLAGPATGAEDPLATALAVKVDGGKPAALTAALAVKGDSAGQAFVGDARARDMAVNVVLPFCHARCGNTEESPAQALYEKFPRLQPNEITREMAEQLLAPEWGAVVTTARRQQGLIHLHRQLAG
ncbi:MAG: DUF2851 family protein [Chloroflexi bacterium]|nr:DUF2851 family protein [Chloroflexota bacterium]